MFFFTIQHFTSSILLTIWH